jgi:hypothetical protein
MIQRLPLCLKVLLSNIDSNKGSNSSPTFSIRHFKDVFNKSFFSFNFKFKIFYWVPESNAVFQVFMII